MTALRDFLPRTSEEAAEMMRKSDKLAARIAPLLYGAGAAVQGAVLADLTATWLAGVQGPDAAEVRAALLEAHANMIRELIPVNEKIMLDRLTGDTRQ